MSVVIQNIVLIGLYVLVGQAAQMIAAPPVYASVFWPSAGVALGFVYLYGFRMLPGVFIAALLNAIFSALEPDYDPKMLTIACSIAFFVTLQAFLGAFFLRRYLGLNSQLQKIRSIIIFSFISVVSCLTAASGATAVFCVAGLVPVSGLLAFWEPWFVGDVMGALIVAPLLLVLLQPASVSRRRGGAVVVPVLLLLALVITLFLNVRDTNLKSEQNQFHGNIGLLHRGIIEEFNAHVNEMASLRSLFRASSYVDREEFEEFVATSFDYNDGIQAFAWAPYVPGGELPQFLEDARQTYDSLYDIKKWSTREGFGDVVANDFHLPIFYVYPHEENRAALGFDLWSNDIRRKAIGEAFEQRSLVVSDPLQLVVSKGRSGLGFLLFEPIFSNGQERHSNGFGQQDVTGVIVGAFLFDEIISPILALWAEKYGVELHLIAEKDGVQNAVFKTHEMDEGDTFIDGFVSNEMFEYVGKQWVFRYYINPDFYHENINFTIWYGFIGGLVFVYFSCVFLLAQTGQAAGMEELIEAKTKELSYKNRFLNIVMDSVPDMVFVKDKDFRIYQANQAFFEKYDPEARGNIIGCTGLEQFPEDEQEIYIENDKIAMEDGFSEVEETITDYRGVTRTLITRKLRFHDEEGQPFLFGYARDVTDFLSAQRKLEAILDSTVDGLITLDARGEIETYNKACEEIFGYTAEEAIGGNINMLIPEGENDEQKTFLSRYVEGGGKNVLGRRSEHQGRRKDGSLFPIDLSVAEVDLGGRRIFSGVLRDISERKKAEELSQQIAQIFNSATIEFYIFDAKTFEFVFVNKSAVQNMGYSEEELIGSRPSEFVPAYDDDQFYDMAKKLLSGEADRFEFDMSHIRKDGSSYDVLINIQATQFDGRPALIASALDVTERNKVVDELKRSNKELENFAYVTSHDLKAPLRHVSMSASFFKEKFGEKMDDKSRELLDVMLSGTTRMQNMIESLLAYSRVGRDDSKFEDVDLNDVLREVQQNLYSDISSSKTRITNGHLPSLHADRYLMIQLFQNLIQNSMKYAKEGVAPKIQISAEEEMNVITVQVADNGIGIDPQYAGKIFQIFQRLHRDHEYDGVGIGLSICQRIVEFHGGSIHLDDQHTGGAKIVFTLLKDQY